MYIYIYIYMFTYIHRVVAVFVVSCVGVFSLKLMKVILVLKNL